MEARGAVYSTSSYRRWSSGLGLDHHSLLYVVNAEQQVKPIILDLWVSINRDTRKTSGFLQGDGLSEKLERRGRNSKVNKTYLTHEQHIQNIPDNQVRQGHGIGKVILLYYIEIHIVLRQLHNWCKMQGIRIIVRLDIVVGTHLRMWIRVSIV